MSYDITFKVKAEGTDLYVPVGDCDANITWNVRDIITKSTGLPWLNEANNGYCKDVIPYIEKGLIELRRNPKKYKQYEPANGWGSVDSTINFFKRVLDDWDKFRKEEGDELAGVTTFWVE